MKKIVYNMLRVVEPLRQERSGRGESQKPSCHLPVKASSPHPRITYPEFLEPELLLLKLCNGCHHTTCAHLYQAAVNPHDIFKLYLCCCMQLELVCCFTVFFCMIVSQFIQSFHCQWEFW